MKFNMPPQPERRNIAISVRVRPSERALLDAAAHLSELSKTELIVQLLHQFMAQHDHGTQADDSNVLADREIDSQ
jgi:hypothetical protein